jgi:hypothetical protein
MKYVGLLNDTGVNRDGNNFKEAQTKTLTPNLSGFLLQRCHSYILVVVGTECPILLVWRSSAIFVHTFVGGTTTAADSTNSLHSCSCPCGESLMLVTSISKFKQCYILGFIFVFRFAVWCYW